MIPGAPALSLDTVRPPAAPLFSAVRRAGEVVAASGGLNLRELGNVVYDARQERPYRLYFSGFSGAYTDNNTFIYVSTSVDGVTYNAPVLCHARALEDPYVLLEHGVYYLFAEDKADVPVANLRRLVSPDGLAWADAGDAGLALGAAGTWDDGMVASPVVWAEGETWYMIYEGLSFTPNFQRGAIGVATSLNKGATWTKLFGGAPVLIPKNDRYPAPPWDIPYGQFAVPDDIRKVDGVYHLLLHTYYADGDQTYGNLLFTSTNLRNWSDALGRRIEMESYAPPFDTLMFDGQFGALLYSVGSSIVRGLPALAAPPAYDKAYANAPQFPPASTWTQINLGATPAGRAIAGGTFTAPVSGLYLVTCSVVMDGLQVGDNVNLALWQNAVFNAGVYAGGNELQKIHEGTQGTAGVGGWSASTTALLKAGDRVAIWIHISASRRILGGTGGSAPGATQMAVTHLGGAVGLPAFVPPETS